MKGNVVAGWAGVRGCEWRKEMGRLIYSQSWRYTQMSWDTCAEMARSLVAIQRSAALTLLLVNNM